MITTLEKVNSTQRLLRITFGLVPVAAGLDKFFNLLTVWTQYLDARFAELLPFSPQTFMHIVGVVEIVAGLIVLSRFTAIGAYIVSGWLALIAVTLIVSGQYLDVAVRDLVMSLGAYTLASLTQINVEITASRETAAHTL